MSLADISRRTKIPLPLLEDLEQERFDRFPSGIFARAYVRSYAEEAGLDQDVVLARVIRKLPGDESLGDVDQAIGNRATGSRSTLAVAPAFLRHTHVTTIFVVAAVILVGLGMSATQPGAGVATRVQQLMSPPLTNSELAAVTLAQEGRAQPVATSGTGPDLRAIDGPASARSDVELPPADSGVLARPSVRAPSRARVTTRRIANHKDDSRVERALSGIGGAFKKLFTGDADKRRTGRGR